MNMFRFSAPLIYWRGPAPHVFAQIPPADSAEIAEVGRGISYGWGCIPVRARIGGVDFVTALIPKDGLYLLPLKLAVRRALELGEGDVVAVEIWLGRGEG